MEREGRGDLMAISIDGDSDATNGRTNNQRKERERESPFGVRVFAAVAPKTIDTSRGSTVEPSFGNFLKMLSISTLIASGKCGLIISMAL